MEARLAAEALQPGLGGEDSGRKSILGSVFHRSPVTDCPKDVGRQPSRMFRIRTTNLRKAVPSALDPTISTTKFLKG